LTVGVQLTYDIDEFKFSGPTNMMIWQFTGVSHDIPCWKKSLQIFSQLIDGYISFFYMPLKFITNILATCFRRILSIT